MHKIAASVVQIENCILLHTDSRIVAVPSCSSTNKKTS